MNTCGMERLFVFYGCQLSSTKKYKINAFSHSPEKITENKHITLFLKSLLPKFYWKKILNFIWKLWSLYIEIYAKM